MADVHLVAAEDTRRTGQLLRKLDIDTALTSYHEHNEREKTVTLLDDLSAGHDIALVTDAGTPCISDPGYRLVRGAREAGYAVHTVPGPSAPIAALAVSGLPTDSFTFHGFFPRKQGARAAAVESLAAAGGTHIFFESPQRLLPTLEHFAAALPGAELCVARELTKIHEEVVTGSPREVFETMARGTVKGECVIIVYTDDEGQRASALTSDEIRRHVQEAMDGEGLSRRDAIRRVSEEFKVPRNAVYAAATDEL